MNLGKAIKEALEYERRIRSFYAEAETASPDGPARSFYASMGLDEQEHVDYLEQRLAEWGAEGVLSFPTLATALPDPARIEEGIRRAAASFTGPALGGRIEALSRALASEEETTAFYRDLVAEADSSPPSGIGGEARGLFSRFLEIEEGHTRIVRAELDLAAGTGHWFDFREFDLED
jgi:rubrerythrin